MITGRQSLGAHSLDHYLLGDKSGGRRQEAEKSPGRQYGSFQEEPWEAGRGPEHRCPAPVPSGHSPPKLNRAGRVRDTATVGAPFLGILVHFKERNVNGTHILTGMNLLIINKKSKLSLCCHPPLPKMLISSQTSLLA